MTDFPAQKLFLNETKLTKVVVKQTKMTQMQEMVQRTARRIVGFLARAIELGRAGLTGFVRASQRRLMQLSGRLHRFSLTTRYHIGVIRRRLGFGWKAAVKGTNSGLKTAGEQIASIGSDRLGRDAATDAERAERTASIDPALLNRTAALPDGECIYAIGDVHGRLDLLEQLIDAIDADAKTLPSDTRITLVFLGDYIDRGMQSRQVVDFLLSERLSPYETVFLMGNHEETLLQFRNDPTIGDQWARYGGTETLFSYGVQPPKTSGPFGANAASEDWQTTWDAFRAKLPTRHLEFYQSLNHYFSLGDYVFVHAGLRPDLPIEQQTTRDMMWIRDEFLKDERPFEKVVVHGHTPTDHVHKDYRRIGLDTGAYYSGELTAARLFGTEVAILAT